MGEMQDGGRGNMSMLKEYLKVRGDAFDEYAWNKRFLGVYARVVPQWRFFRSMLDVGSGGGGFVRVCRDIGMNAYGVDNEIDFEKDAIPVVSDCFDFVHMNAVIEHLANPENIMREIWRVLNPHGKLIINTPNWKMDSKNFYNDPTHKRPYTPESLTMLVKMFGFKVLLCEPALIRRSPLWWKCPFKWRVASLLPKGSRSILLVAEKLT